MNWIEIKHQIIDWLIWFDLIWFVVVKKKNLQQNQKWLKPTEIVSKVEQRWKKRKKLRNYFANYRYLFFVLFSLPSYSPNSIQKKAWHMVFVSGNFFSFIWPSPFKYWWHTHFVSFLNKLTKKKNSIKKYSEYDEYEATINKNSFHTRCSISLKNLKNNYGNLNNINNDNDDDRWWLMVASLNND